MSSSQSPFSQATSSVAGIREFSPARRINQLNAAATPRDRNDRRARATHTRCRTKPLRDLSSWYGVTTLAAPSTSRRECVRARRLSRSKRFVGRDDRRLDERRGVERTETGSADGNAVVGRRRSAPPDEGRPPLGRLLV